MVEVYIRRAGRALHARGVLYIFGVQKVPGGRRSVIVSIFVVVVCVVGVGR